MCLSVCVCVCVCLWVSVCVCVNHTLESSTSHLAAVSMVTSPAASGSRSHTVRSGSVTLSVRSAARLLSHMRVISV